MVLWVVDVNPPKVTTLLMFAEPKLVVHFIGMKVFRMSFGENVSIMNVLLWRWKWMSEANIILLINLALTSFWFVWPYCPSIGCSWIGCWRGNVIHIIDFVTTLASKTHKSCRENFFVSWADFSCNIYLAWVAPLSSDRHEITFWTFDCNSSRPLPAV